MEGLNLPTMNLALDIGNTAVKAAFFKDGEIFHFKRMLLDDSIKTLSSMLAESPVKQVVISDVTGNATDLIDWLEMQTKVLVVDFETKIPIQSDYKSKTLGSDRIALACGAWNESNKHASLVLSLGTCLTADWINSAGVYLGGSISPGVRMKFNSLHNFTGKLPLLEPEESWQQMGNTTHNSIMSGVMNGILLEMNGIIDQFMASNPNGKVFLTGGDANWFVDDLKNPIFADNFLLLKGLNQILEYQNKS